MKVVFTPGGEYTDSILQHFSFEDYDDGKEDIVLFYGYNGYRNFETLNKYRNSIRIFCSTEQPCGFDLEPQFHMQCGSNFDIVYTICPYTGKWLNEVVYGYEKYRLWGFCLGDKFVCREQPEKEFDAIYWGGVYHRDHVDIIETISKFKYHYFTLTTPGPCANLLSGFNIPRIRMWDILRRTKVMVGSNILYYPPGRSSGIKAIPRFEENEAFNRIDYGIAPQLKTRPIEAALNKTLLVLKRTPWNLIDNWFVENEEFVSYGSKEELEHIIKDVSENWNRYTPIVERAYRKALGSLTTSRFMERVRTDVKGLVRR